MLMPVSSTGLAGRRDAHQLAAVRARRGEPLDHDVALGDERVQLAVPVRERRRGTWPPAVRIPSASGGSPIGGSWFTKSAVRYWSVAPRSPSVNSASMNRRTTTLLSSMLMPHRLPADAPRYPNKFWVVTALRRTPAIATNPSQSEHRRGGARRSRPRERFNVLGCGKGSVDIPVTRHDDVVRGPGRQPEGGGRPPPGRPS